MRINDVSKNHQRQRFRILVSPDTGMSLEQQTEQERWQYDIEDRIREKSVSNKLTHIRYDKFEELLSIDVKGKHSSVRKWKRVSGRGSVA